MKLLKSKLFNRIHWVAFGIPFVMWLYINLFVGTANTKIDNVCLPICIVLFIMIIVRKIICDFDDYEYAEEPRFLIDKESQCYGCQYYKKKIDCIQDHIDDDFDNNMGTCDVDCICTNGSMNNYRNKIN